jgi:hypothetical protein
MRQALQQARDALAELVATVRGECSSLLDEDSGGSSRLSMECDDAIAKADEALAADTPVALSLTDEQCDNAIRKVGLWQFACALPSNLALLRGLARAGYETSPQPPASQDDNARDAARYRWLRDGDSDAPTGCFSFPVITMFSTQKTLWGEEADAAIDNAMAASTPKGKA